MPPAATLNGLMRATQTEVTLTPEAQALLSRETVTVRRIAKSTHSAFFPNLPAELLKDLPSNDPAEFRARELQWINEAPSADRVRYRVDLEQVKFRAVAHALVDPQMTEEEVERLGDDAFPIYVAVLRLSGLLPENIAVEGAAQSEPSAA